MEKTPHEQRPNEALLPVTLDEANLISNLIYAALKHKQMNPLDETQKKMAEGFMVRLQKMALFISKQPIR